MGTFAKLEFPQGERMHDVLRRARQNCIDKNLDPKGLRALKFDIKSAYRIFGIDQADWWALCFSFEGKRYTHKRWPFGLTSSVYGFLRFPGQIETIHSRLEKAFPDKKGLAIYNQEEHRYDELLIDGEMRPFSPDNDTLNLNWLAYSPSMSPGIDIKDPFDVMCVYGDTSDHVAGVRYLCQMMYRVRKLNKELVLFQIAKSQISRLPLDTNKIRQEYIVGQTLLTQPDLELERDMKLGNLH